MSNIPSLQPRKASILENYRKSITLAFRKDCEDFFKKFEKFQSYRYESFAAAWQLTNFTYIYADQTYVSTLTILCETCFHSLKVFILTQSNSLHVRVAALYILYGLYYKQPVKGMVKIRIILEEYKALKSFLEVMRTQKCLDPLYCFIKLKSDNAFLFVARQKVLKLENHRLSSDHIPFEGFHLKDSEGSLSKFESLIGDPTIKSLEDTCKQYEEKMKSYAENCPSLAPFQTTIIADFQKCYENVVNVDIAELNEKQKPPEMSLYKKRQGIKKRAMRNKKSVYRGAKKSLTKVALEDQLLFGKMELEKSSESDSFSE